VNTGGLRRYPKTGIPDLWRGAGVRESGQSTGSARLRRITWLFRFQKKSPKGVKTAAVDIELVARRLKLAQLDYEERYGETKE